MVAVYPDLLGEQAPPPAGDEIIRTLTPLFVTRQQLSKFSYVDRCFYITGIYTHTHTYIYMCVCVCVCVLCIYIAKSLYSNI